MLTFRPLAEADFPLLTAWLAQPHVRRFYQKTALTQEEVAAEYRPAVHGEEPSLCHLAYSDGAAFAYLQCYRNADYPQWAATIGVPDGISVDLFIGDPAWRGRGLGRAALRAYVDEVGRRCYPAERRACIAHALDNAAALRCSQAAGFRPLRMFLEEGVQMMLLEKVV